LRRHSDSALVTFEVDGFDEERKCGLERAGPLIDAILAALF
jgi:hypothetical protein